RRGDPWARAAVRLLAAAFWFHPIVLLAVRRVEALREACCDATVARILGPGTPAYRDALVRAAERLVGRPRGASAARGVLGRGDGLADRLRALEGTPWRGARARAAGSLAAGAFVLGCLAPMAAPPGAPPAAGDDRGLAQARALLDSAGSGGRESCWQVRFAAIRVAQEEGLLPGPGRVPSSGEVGP
ncbi:MAG TPA: M56 family metallopeptidase, partial [Planctomycetota bacterium]|nr:M56 family metallopeptidase [Planctomycetota bacterium]